MRPEAARVPFDLVRNAAGLLLVGQEIIDHWLTGSHCPCSNAQMPPAVTIEGHLERAVRKTAAQRLVFPECRQGVGRLVASPCKCASRSDGLGKGVIARSNEVRDFDRRAGFVSRSQHEKRFRDGPLGSGKQVEAAPSPRIYRVSSGIECFFRLRRLNEEESVQTRAP